MYEGPSPADFSGEFGRALLDLRLTGATRPSRLPAEMLMYTNGAISVIWRRSIERM